MEGIRIKISRGEMISSAMGLSFEENKTWSSPEQWESCPFGVDAERMQNPTDPPIFPGLLAFAVLPAPPTDPQCSPEWDRIMPALCWLLTTADTPKHVYEFLCGRVFISLCCIPGSEVTGSKGNSFWATVKLSKVTAVF